MEYDISAQGTLYTVTQFRNKDNSTVRVKVWFDKESTYANSITFYNYRVDVRKYKHKIFNKVTVGYNTANKEYKKYMTEQDLYTCFFNHWHTVNPIRIFSTGQIGDSKSMRYMGFEVIPNELEPYDNVTIRKSFI